MINVCRSRRSVVMCIALAVHVRAAAAQDAPRIEPPARSVTDSDATKPEPKESVHVRGELAGSGMVSVPYGDSGGLALGFAISLAAGWGPLPLLIGVDFMSGWGASARSKVTVSGAGDAFAVDRVRQDNLLFFDLWARLQPPYWPVRPYLEGVVGTKHLRTEDSLFFPSSPSQPSGRTNIATEHDWASSVGWGAGLDLAGLLHVGHRVSLGLGFRHLRGGVATLSRSTAPLGNGTVVSYRATTNANLFMLTLVGFLDFAGASPKSEAW